MFMLGVLPWVVFARDEAPDITGYWDGMLHIDFIGRMWGPEPGETYGLPLNHKGVQAVKDFDAEYYYNKAENQCRTHGAGYVMRGPFAKHFVYEDEHTLLIRIELEAQTRRIYLDGRPPPSDEHTNLGHSVGRWEDGILKVTTTHMTPYFHERNGAPYSKDAVMEEHFILHDDKYITLVTIIDDPEYLHEPLVRPLTFRKLPDSYEKRFTFEYDCEVIEWEGGAPGALTAE